MPIIPTPTLPEDNTDADVGDYNPIFTAILSVLNGHVDGDNVEAESLDNSHIATGANIDPDKLDSGTNGVGNAHLNTTAGDVGGSWLTFAPAFVNLAGGTLTYAKYTKVGKLIHYRIRYDFTGANISGTVTFTPPVEPHAEISQTGISHVGTVICRDTGTAVFFGTVVWITGGSFQVNVMNAAGTYVTPNTPISATVPHTWANTDGLFIDGYYEAA